MTVLKQRKRNDMRQEIMVLFEYTYVIIWLYLSKISHHLVGFTF